MPTDNNVRQLSENTLESPATLPERIQEIQNDLRFLPAGEPMDLKSLLALLSMAILARGRKEIPDSTNDNETIQHFSSSSLCFGRFDNLQNEFCNFKINIVEEKLSAKLNECNSELTSVTIREIARSRHVDCKSPKGSENWLQLSTGFYYFSKHHEVVHQIGLCFGYRALIWALREDSFGAQPGSELASRNFTEDNRTTCAEGKTVSSSRYICELQY
ncbi:Hypothetical predicted protein [Cloeon dipterum]|uniref:Uncharacterized protein n=1 Tax=Cloeon dipterum TaxID=197152 RepID=A0A8S1DDH0_9INSE|nr:Hypothetical predicted protein [Cloeon dipterum]